MSLTHLLADKRSSIIKRWQDVIVDSYPKDSRGFFKKSKSQFSNPVGYLIAKEIEALYDQVIQGDHPDKISSCLDTIIRIRAVQDFTPSEAVAFVPQLKDIIREELNPDPSPQLEALEKQIDKALLMAFDVYSKCREKIYELRVNEVRNQVGRLLERANLIVEIPDRAPGLDDDNARTVL